MLLGVLNELWMPEFFISDRSRRWEAVPRPRLVVPTEPDMEIMAILCAFLSRLAGEPCRPSRTLAALDFLTSISSLRFCPKPPFHCLSATVRAQTAWAWVPESVGFSVMVPLVLRETEPPFTCG